MLRGGGDSAGDSPLHLGAACPGQNKERSPSRRQTLSTLPSVVPAELLGHALACRGYSSLRSPPFLLPGKWAPERGQPEGQAGARQLESLASGKVPGKLPGRWSPPPSPGARISPQAWPVFHGPGCRCPEPAQASWACLARSTSRSWSVKLEVSQKAAAACIQVLKMMPLQLSP